MKEKLEKVLKNAYSPYYNFQGVFYNDEEDISLRVLLLNFVLIFNKKYYY